ncbi:MAG: alpha-amylase family protein [Chloroflexota bacterium]
MSDSNQTPWYQRARRWGQTNITEIDPTRYDIDWWRSYWKRVRVQGVIINGGGIVAYYPSRFPQHYRAQHLGDRDLFGEVAQAAHEEGLAVLARMDSNRTTKEFYEQRPEWFTRDANGEPYMAQDRYITCIFSDYYEEFLTQVLREIAERYQPQGFTDNSWSGLRRKDMCQCENCARSFRDKHGVELPTAVDWDSPVYRAWVRWNYDRRLEIWDLFNKTTQSAGGPDCLWLGMLNGSVHNQSGRFRDHKALLERSKILMLDYQTRVQPKGMTNNSDAGKLAHGIMGWDILAPESMAQYQGRVPTFRLASKPPAESNLWMAEGFASGIQPWWHFISAYHEDRRQYKTPVPMVQWHAENEEYLFNRRPVASIGLLWSQENVDYYGRDVAKERVIFPYSGMVQALIRARIPYLPIHVDHIARDASQLTTLLLPNIGALSDEHVESIRNYVQAGGNLVVTGQTSLYTESGERRPDFALADLLGVHATEEQIGQGEIFGMNWESYSDHSYLRLTPELRAQVDGPLTGNEPAIGGERHPTLVGFEETDILGFGGRLEVVRIDEGAGDETVVPLTLIPPFPIYPPEFSWMREPRSDHPALVLRTAPASGRVAYLPTDIDRLFAKYYLPDHGDLLANVVRWASQGQIPLRVEGCGIVDCHLYQQEGRMILHMVNLTATGHMPVHEHIPVGPFQVAIQLNDDVPGSTVKALVAQQPLSITVEDGWVNFEMPSIEAHEVVVVT